METLELFISNDEINDIILKEKNNIIEELFNRLDKKNKQIERLKTMLSILDVSNDVINDCGCGKPPVVTPPTPPANPTPSK